MEEEELTGRNITVVIYTRVTKQQDSKTLLNQDKSLKAKYRFEVEWINFLHSAT